MIVFKMNKAIEDMRPIMNAVEWENPQVYGNWLSQIYRIVKKSTPYLGLCLFLADKYPEFQKRCERHIAEEAGHEKLIENDLKRLGIAMMPELVSTMATYQPQPFRLIYDNLSFMGYIFFLELLAPAYGEMAISRVQNKEAVSFLKLHAREDIGHLDSAKAVLNSMPPEAKDAILSNFYMTLKTYTTMLEEIIEISRYSENKVAN